MSREDRGCLAVIVVLALIFCGHPLLALFALLLLW
jgi:hypothetical protein